MTIVAAAVALSACSSDGSNSSAETTGAALPLPELVTATKPPVPPPEVAQWRAPALSGPQPAWKAPFDDVPLAAGDTLVGVVFPVDTQSDLSIVGVDLSGATRWRVWTNPSCVGYGVTRVNDRPAAVVLASNADNRGDKVATETTANAYDAQDGHRVWGPVRVPGPLQGPGLIFGKVTASVVGGETGPRVMLNTDTGEPVEPPTRDAVPLYEHDGLGLFGKDGTLTAVDTSTGEVLWTSTELHLPPQWPSRARSVELLSSTQASKAGVVALRWSGSDGDGAASAPRTALHDLRTGNLLVALGNETDVRTVVADQGKAAIVAGLNGFTETRAYDLDSGQLDWTINGGGAGLVDITVADGGVGFGTRAGQSVAVQLATGRILEQGDWPAPVAANKGTLLTALPRDPAAEPNDRLAGAGPGFVAYRTR
ncbi:PQQ-like beta-propeller repeat protein [Prauserella muralis]|uniref:PQQ-like beta-propeller repeat protein n=1 Tax=Prauserella muralis TaxID=588067 RepID=UPI001FE9F44E|nr:PQQ-like beta-propeller repeat protein [Prauserella muralis]